MNSIAESKLNSLGELLPILALHYDDMTRTWRPTENCLVQFTGEQLSDPQLYKIWEAYDVNADERMDRDELSFLMEDLCEVSPLVSSALLMAMRSALQCFAFVACSRKP